MSQELHFKSQIDLTSEKTLNNEGLKKSDLPSKEQFFELETLKELTYKRPLWVSMGLRLLMGAVLLANVPVYLVFSWFSLSILTLYAMHASCAYFYKQMPNTANFLANELREKFQKFKVIWFLNAVAIGSGSILAQLWLSTHQKMFFHTVLTATMYLFLTRNCADKRFMNQITLSMIGTSFLGGVLFLLLSDQPANDFNVFIRLCAYLCINTFMLFLVGTRFNTSFDKRCNSDYSNLVLIQSLKESEEKLHVEQEALTAANSVIQQFYSAAAHDLRQPVYAMELYTDMLKDDPTQMDHLLPKIAQSCMFINHMFNDLFDFQQKHLNDSKVEETVLSISDTLKSLALHFEPIAAAKNLKISFKPLEGNVQTIPLYFVRILSNLIANAITYTAEGRILVAARKSGNMLSFEVWDTGPGIDKKSQTKIFEEFYKINNTGVKTSNLGLGLSIVKGLTKRINGAKIQVVSKLGHGSAFKLQLPIETYSAPQKVQLVESSMHYDI